MYLVFPNKDGVRNRKKANKGAISEVCKYLSLTLDIAGGGGREEREGRGREKNDILYM